MKKNLLFLMILLLPISAKAASMEIKCSSTNITVGDSVRCTVTAKATQVGGAEGFVDITNGTVASTEKKVCEIGDPYDLDLPTNKMKLSCANVLVNNTADIAVYTLKSSATGKMTFGISSAKVVDESFNTVSVTSPSVTITVNPKATQPPSTKPTTRPTSPAQEQPQTQAPVTEAPQTQAPNTEPVTEEPATEEITTTDYVRPTSPKTDVTSELKSLKVKGVELQFNPSNYTYNFTVKNNVQNLDISYEKGNDDQVVVVSNTTLKNGLNKIYVEVTEGDSKTTYTLNATREAGMSTTKLIKIVASSGGLVGLSYALLKILKRR